MTPTLERTTLHLQMGGCKLGSFNLFFYTCHAGLELLSEFAGECVQSAEISSFVIFCTLMLLFEHEVKDATKGAEQSSIEANISKQHKSIQISRKIQNSFLLLPSTSGIWPPFSLCVAMALSPCLQRNAIAKAYTVVTTLSTTILI